MMTKELISKKDIKLFEVEIKVTIVYPTFSFVELYNFDCEIRELIGDLFEQTDISIKKDSKGLEELEILDVKEVLREKNK